MSYQIKFENPNKEFIYTGRNGTGACHGIDIFPIIDSKTTPQKVIIAPINSKGNVANCDMQFPISEIDQIIGVLRSIKMQAEMSGIQLPKPLKVGAIVNVEAIPDDQWSGTIYRATVTKIEGEGTHAVVTIEYSNEEEGDVCWEVYAHQCTVDE